MLEILLSWPENLPTPIELHNKTVVIFGKRSTAQFTSGIGVSVLPTQD